MRKLILTVLCAAILSVLSGQAPSFTIDVTSDSIYYGNAIYVKFSLQNTHGDFQPPSFEGYDVVGGPNTSSQYSIVNGVVSQSSTYSYILMPRAEGLWPIDAAKLENGAEVLLTEPVEIIILPNPDGIIQSGARYGYRQEIVYKKDQKPLSKEDSLKLKIRRLKSTKI